MESYSAIKLLHVSCALISITLFFYRWSLHRQKSALLAGSTLRILPHVIDTVLLGSALGLIVMGPFDLLSEHWILAKILLVIGYILFGIRAFKKNLPMDVRQKAFGWAVVCVSLIVLLALEHLFRVNHGNILNNGAKVNAVEEFDHSAGQS